MTERMQELLERLMHLQAVEASIIQEINDNIAKQREILEEVQAFADRTWCSTHQRPFKVYGDGVEACPDCLALDGMAGTLQGNEGEDWA